MKKRRESQVGQYHETTVNKQLSLRFEYIQTYEKEIRSKMETINKLVKFS